MLNSLRFVESTPEPNFGLGLVDEQACCRIDFGLRFFSSAPSELESVRVRLGIELEFLSDLLGI